MNDNLIIDCFAGGGAAPVRIEMAMGRQWREEEYLLGERYKLRKK